MSCGRVTWLGHATTRIELGGARLLTDPLLTDRLVHITRRVPPAAPAGRVDAVLVSHAHLDHLHGASLRAVDTPLVVVPRGAARLVPGGRRGPAGRAGDGVATAGPQIAEVGPGDVLDVAGVPVRVLPAGHRVVRRGRAIPALQYVVGERVLFAGDTDRLPDERDLDLALVPVWGYGPTLGPGHLDPEQAAAEVARIRPRAAVPIHWGTYFPVPFPSGHPRFREPGGRFATAVARLAPAVRVAVLAPGQAVDLGTERP